MKFEIIERAWDRYDIDTTESDLAAFMCLLYSGEMLTKLVCAGLVAGLDEDPKKHRYTQIFHLIRANSLGDWSKSIDEIISGPTSYHLSFDIKNQQRELTQKHKSGSWQFDSVELIHECLSIVDDSYQEELPVKISGKQWFSLFARLRNTTRGHGAQKPNQLSRVLPILKRSIELISQNFGLFKYQWAFLYQNLSGKYRVSKISEDTSSFLFLSSNDGKIHHHRGGVYIYINNKPTFVDLIKSDADLTDFYFPNGGFNQKRYEVISYITGNKDSKDSSSYLLPPGELPTSHTEGVESLEIVGKCLTNIPKTNSIYIKREELEAQVKEVLLNERHPVVTLLGRGGIGKTSLALNLLQEVCSSDRFEIVLWFSSRDIDLLDEGAKSVQPQILDIDDVANEFVRLIDENKLKEKEFNARKHIEDNMTNSELGNMLIVFDNFETVKNPLEMFTWLDTYIRNPNKILITSRIREFKADYPITIGGMNEDEFSELTDSVASKLEIKHLLNSQYLSRLYEESGGHPYVAKVLLGVVAKEKRAGTIDRIVASEDELLQALFERTYSNLTQAARKVLLILSSWRSTIPKIGLEAVVTGTSDSKIDVEAAIQELYSYSFIDINETEYQGNELVFLPLSSFLFGKRKLNVSTFKQSVLETREILMMFGVGKLSTINEGGDNRFQQFFINVAREIQKKRGKKLTFFKPILEYICRKHNDAWLIHSSLMEELKKYDEAIDACQNYLQFEGNQDKTIAVWKKLSFLHSKKRNHLGEMHALVEMCEIPTTSDASVDSTVNKLNKLISEDKLEDNIDDRNAIVERMISIVKKRFEFKEEYFDEYSNIAWLYIHIQKIKEAKDIIRKILKDCSDHIYAKKIGKRLGLIK